MNKIICQCCRKGINDFHVMWKGAGKSFDIYEKDIIEVSKDKEKYYFVLCKLCTKIFLLEDIKKEHSLFKFKVISEKEFSYIKDPITFNGGKMFICNFYNKGEE